MHAVGIARWVFLNKIMVDVNLNFNRAWRALAVMVLQHPLLSKSQSVLASTTRVVTKMLMDLALGGAVDLAVLELGMGGCRGVKGHSETHLSERQRMKARVRNTSIQQQQPSHITTSTSIHAPSPVYFGDLTLAQLLSDSNLIPPLQHKDKQREQAEQLVADQALANFAKSLSENNPVVQLKREDKRREQAEQLAADQELAEELQEEEEHQALLAEARAACLSSPLADPGPSTTTSSSDARSSTFRVSGLPVTRVTLSNRPTITTQMNETWMCDYEDKTKEKRRVGGNSQIDLEMVQKFRVIWWEKVRVLPFPLNTTIAYSLIIRMVLGLSFLRSKNVLIGQSGRLQTPLLLLHGWEIMPFSSTI